MNPVLYRAARQGIEGLAGYIPTRRRDDPTNYEPPLTPICERAS